jgi:hypothetical protein
MTLKQDFEFSDNNGHRGRVINFTGIDVDEDCRTILRDDFVQMFACLKKVFRFELILFKFSESTSIHSRILVVPARAHEPFTGDGTGNEIIAAITENLKYVLQELLKFEAEAPPIDSPKDADQSTDQIDVITTAEAPKDIKAQPAVKSDRPSKTGPRIEEQTKLPEPIPPPRDLPPDFDFMNLVERIERQKRRTLRRDEGEDHPAATL